MTLRELQYLLALAEHRNFHRAAEVCLVSQPTLSTQIRKLEEELGVTLIERAPRRIMLTPVGAEIVARARRVMSEIGEIQETARRHAAPEAGRVTLGAFPTLGPYLLPHVVPALRARFPHLELHLVEEKSDQLLVRLREGRLDAALLALPIADDQLHVAPLFEESFLLAVPSGHPLTRKPSLAAGDISDQELMLLEEGHCLRDQALDLCRLSGARESAGFRATSLETLRQMVAAGVGITLLPALATRNQPAGGAVELLHFDGPPPSRQIALVWRRSSALAGLLDELAALIRGLPRGLFTAEAA